MKGHRGAGYEYAIATITLDASGNGSASIIWTEDFATAPLVLVIPHQNDSGSWTVSAITTTGATLTATASDTRSATIQVVLVAHERL